MKLYLDDDKETENKKRSNKKFLSLCGEIGFVLGLFWLFWVFNLLAYACM